jgi:hypothetical protein
MKFYVNPSNESPFVPCGKTDEQTDGRTDRQTRHDEANNRFPQRLRTRPQTQTKNQRRRELYFFVACQSLVFQFVAVDKLSGLVQCHCGQNVPVFLGTCSHTVLLVRLF